MVSTKVLWLILPLSPSLIPPQDGEFEKPRATVKITNARLGEYQRFIIFCKHPSAMSKPNPSIENQNNAMVQTVCAIESSPYQGQSCQQIGNASSGNEISEYADCGAGST